MKTVGKVLTVIFGIYMVAVGIYCLFTPMETYTVLGWVIGFCMIVDAFGRFFAWSSMRKEGEAAGWMLFGAIISLVLGVFILNDTALQLSLDLVIVYYVAAWLIVRGIMAVIQSFKMHKVKDIPIADIIGRRWWIVLLFGILALVFGILCLFKPVVMASTIGVFMGLGIIVTGCELVTIATLPTVPEE